jgi:hypothetical protein
VRRVQGLPRLVGDASGVQGTSDDGVGPAFDGQREDAAHDGRALRVELDAALLAATLVQPAVGVVAVRERPAEVVAALGLSALAGPRGPALALGVLMVSLAGDDRIEQIGERLRVLDRVDRDVVLQRPERVVDEVLRGLAVAPGEPVGVLHDQRGLAVLGGEPLALSQGGSQAGTTVGLEGTGRLVVELALGHQVEALVLGELLGVGKLARDLAVLVLGGFGGEGDGVRDGHRCSFVSRLNCAGSTSGTTRPLRCSIHSAAMRR